MKRITRKLSWLLLVAMLFSMFSNGIYAADETAAPVVFGVVETQEPAVPEGENREPAAPAAPAVSGVPEATTEPGTETGEKVPETTVDPKEPVTDAEKVDETETKGADEIAGYDDQELDHIDVRIQNVTLNIAKKVVDVTTGAQIGTSTTETVTASVVGVKSVTINGTKYTGFYKMDNYEFRKNLHDGIDVDDMSTSSTATLVLDLADRTGNVYKDVSFSYDYSGIVYAMEHCDGFTTMTLPSIGVIPGITLKKYSGIDFDPGKGTVGLTGVTRVSYVFPVEKKWDDGNNQDGNRPASVTVQLYANGKAVKGKTLTLNANNNWKGQFENLDSVDSCGKTIKYTVDETCVPAGYTKSVSGGVITNSYTPKTTSVTISKAWSDGNDQDGIRPEKIEVALYAGDVKVGEYEVKKSENWTLTIDNLPLNYQGKKIVYSVVETGVDGYEGTVTGNGTGSVTITNTHTPETMDITVNKVWKDNDDQDGIRPETITVSVTAKGAKEAAATAQLKADEDGKWTYTFEDLPKFKGGEAIEYEVTETAVSGYTTEIAEKDGVVVITNTHTPETTDITVNKVWKDNDDQDGIRPETITVSVTAKGAKEAVATAQLKADEDGKWTYTFEDLPKFKGGEAIEYEVTETAVSGYTTEIAEKDGVVTITNTHTPETTAITVNKVWEDNDDQDGVRPETITVSVTAKGAKEAAATAQLKADEDGKWTYTFEDLPKFKGGEAIEYEVTETAVSGYTTEIAEKDGVVTITNTHTPETTAITVNKVWEDNDDQDGIRPETITVYVTVKGEKEPIATAQLKADKDGKWSFTFEDLPKFAEGEKIEYVVTEKPVEGYSTEITGNGTDTVTITNKHVSQIDSIFVSKVWKDNNNKENKRPESIKVILYANGREISSAELSEKNQWSAWFENLPVNEDGAEIKYEVKEVGVKYYVGKVTGNVEDGFVITNTYVDIPLTGDTMNLLFWGLMIVGAGAVLTGLGVHARRKRA